MLLLLLLQDDFDALGKIRSFLTTVVPLRSCPHVRNEPLKISCPMFRLLVGQSTRTWDFTLHKGSNLTNKKLFQP
jgi:hypothetical protein